MAAPPEQTTRAARKAQKEARFREIAAGMMDIGRGAPRFRDSVATAVEEALGTSA